MSYQEKENIVNIFSTLVIGFFYGLAIYSRQMDGRLDLASDYQQWGKVILAFIGISIVARIIIYIIFHIINAIAVRGEQDIPPEDERAKLIKLKSTRNAYVTVMGGTMLAMLSLILGWPPYVLLLGFMGSSMLADIVDNLSQLIFHRKGI